MLFSDRMDAGQKLAVALARYAGQDVVVYALPRGGVVLGAVIARALHAPLDVIITRKIGHPYNPEYAICAISEHGHMVCNEEERAQVDPNWFAQATTREQAEARRRRERYLAGRAPIPAEGKTAIIVDDGIATGLTMRAAIADIRDRQPARVVVAVPVIPAETAEVLRREADDVVAVDITPDFLGAVGAYYANFSQVSDDEVIRLLQDTADPVVLFALPEYRELGAELRRQCGLAEGTCDFSRFPNGELAVAVSAAAGNTCVLLAQITPPDERLLMTLLLAQTLKKEGARTVDTVLPYLAYMRQDKEEPGKSITTAWVGVLLAACGVDRVATVDLHSALARQVFPLPLRDLSPARLFAEEIRRSGLQDAVLAAPDEGAISRCEAVRDHLGSAMPVMYFTKVRGPEGVRVALHGQPSPRVIFIDDMLDTGGTLVACSRLLREAGTEEIYVMVTHGLFTGSGWQRLWELGVQRICCTDTVPLPAALYSERIRVLSVAPVLREGLVEMGHCSPLS